ncbi:hypothetical protein [Streptomyces xylophagus]|uniref:hypothetical protein n=1 Tax=Streptomyces xylophagus TaxID=285514 RepID=UPI000AE7897D|nr:hypothetical protein [Streptomyces xylophagus]
MAGFNREEFDADEEATRLELSKYGLHKDRAFMAAFDGYMNRLADNGRWLNEGHAVDNDSWAGDAAEKLIAQFDRYESFHVPAKWWRDVYRKNKRDKNFDLRATVVNKGRGLEGETRAGKYLWSKSEAYYPAKQAALAGDMILETSNPGRLFNGRGYGFERWSDAPVQARLWEKMSGNYVDGAEGPVTALMLGGRVAGSVLTKYEWPHLKKLIKEGKVPHMHVKLLGIRGDSNDSATWSLTTRESFNVTTQASFDRIPSPDEDFPAKQNRWRNREIARHALDDSSSSPSSSGESSSSNHSLENFHKVFDDPNAVVRIVDPYAPFAESPEQLSRSTSGGAPLYSTEGQSGRELTRINVLNELAALAQGEQSLKQKIANMEAAQQRRASESASPPVPTQYYAHALTDGMATMSPFGASRDGYSPQAVSPRSEYFPASASSYQPQGQYTVPDPRYTAESDHYSDQQYPRGRESADPREVVYDYGEAPVYPEHVASEYNDPRSRVPSTTSGSSGGVPLEGRTPSPPEQQVHGSSSDSGSAGGVPLAEEWSPGPSEREQQRSRESKSRSKKPKEPSSALKYFAGKVPGGRPR